MSKILAILGIINFVFGGIVWFWSMTTLFGIITFLGILFLAISYLIPEKRYVFHPVGYHQAV